MNAAKLINQTSGKVEFYTPANIVEAARKALGGRIELDPASSAKANETIQADRIFTEADDGLSRVWNCATLWMNHPFGKESNPLWLGHLLRDWESGAIASAACCITFASTSERWFRPLLDRPQCYLWPRTNYHLPDGTLFRGVTKGSVVTYFGSRLELFEKAFRGLGTVKV